MELEEAPSDDRNGTRPAPSADHRRVDRHRRRVRSRARGSRRLIAMRVRRFAMRFRGQELEVALEATTGWRFVVEELEGDRRAGAPGRAGRDGGAARDQEARQERSRRRAAPARAADGRPAAGVVDPARAPARPASPRQVAPHAGRSAPRVAAAHAGGALSPRRPAAQLADERRVARVAGGPGAATSRARADHRRAGDDRRARRCSWHRSTKSCATTPSASPAAGR